jgi:hypothetical protein
LAGEPFAHTNIGIVLLRIHNDAVEDLKAIKATNAVAFGRLFALLEQLRADQNWQSRLLDHGHGAEGREPISVSKWHKMWPAKPLWRLKFLDLEKTGLRFRIIYVYNWRDKSFSVMAITPRGTFDYDNPNDPIRLRVARRLGSEFGAL